MGALRYMFLAVLVLLCPERKALSEELFKVGAILPLSGALSSFGENVREGILLGAEALPPEVRNRIAVSFEDDASQPARAVAAYQKLVQQGRARAIFVFGSGMGNAIAPLAERDGVVTIAIAASDNTIAKGKRFIFTHWVSPEAEAEAIVREMRRRKYARVGIVEEEHDGLRALTNALRAELSTQGMKEIVVFERSFSGENHDFRTAAAQGRSANLDAVGLFLFPSSAGMFAKQARQLGFMGEYFSADVLEDGDVVKAAEGALEGAWYSNGSNGTALFRERYKKRFGREPLISAANGYDAIQLVAHAMREGESAEKLAEALSTLKDFEGACGRYSATGDNRFRLPAILKSIAGAEFQELS